jgi:hypothetical protein
MSAGNTDGLEKAGFAFGFLVYFLFGEFFGQGLQAERDFTLLRGLVIGNVSCLLWSTRPRVLGSVSGQCFRL